MAHVYRHTKDNLAKSFHGIYNDAGDVIGIMNDAYNKVKNGVEGVDYAVDIDINSKISYIVNMDEVIGTLGGSQGTGQQLDKLLLVLEKESGNITNKVINAYPY